ncbi:MAG: AAA family ATPase [Firmicutes bacterium]|nr:AAA family ATPase [Bacillota bacterium]
MGSARKKRPAPGTPPDAAPSQPSASLEGTVERVTFRNPETYYTVLRVRPGTAGRTRGRKGAEPPNLPAGALNGGLITVVGTFPQISPGQGCRFVGHWQRHPEYGLQFAAEYSQEVLPVSKSGIERYLGSGLIKGVGPALAKRLVERFGADTLRVIRQEPERLVEIPGIGPQTASRICQSLREQAATQEIMAFLVGQGISPAYAKRILLTYGPAAADKVREDPYGLIQDVRGIGFKTADRIAMNLGFSAGDPRRLVAGLRHILEERAENGHLFLPERVLLQEAAQLLGMTETAPLVAALQAMASAGTVVCQQVPVQEFAQAWAGLREEAARPGQGGAGVSAAAGLGSGAAPPVGGMEPVVYLARLHRAEVAVAQGLAARLAAGGSDAQNGTPRVRSARGDQPGQGVAEAPAASAGGTEAQSADDRVQLEAATGLSLAEGQWQAVLMGRWAGVGILTGGPGTGKTTAVRAVLADLKRDGRRVLLAAPTGRAAKRLSEATGWPARTIHRLLEYGPGEGDEQWGFQRNHDHPLDADVVIVDEASMVDLPLFRALLDALRPETRLLLVGDADQLPSVGPGNVLRDLLQSPAVPSVKLDKIFRQAQQSLIVVNAHRIHAGQMPESNAKDGDFWFIAEDDPTQVAQTVVNLVSRRLPDYLHCDPLEDIQVLSPMHRGDTGVDRLNILLQAVLNPPGPAKGELAVGQRLFRTGDKVMQLVNDYQKQVFNGDIGRIAAVDRENGVLEVEFPAVDGPSRLRYEREDLDELSMAYAITVHKSQGSEFPVVVLPLVTAHFPMLQRNLLYTAVTRAKRYLVIVGSRKALAIAVKKEQSLSRFSLLSWRLQQALQQQLGTAEGSGRS